MEDKEAEDQEALAKVIAALEKLESEDQRRVIDTAVTFLEIPPRRVMRGD